MSFRESRSISKPLLLFIGLALLAAIFGGVFIYNNLKWENAVAAKLAELEAHGIPTTLHEINRRYHDHNFDPAENAAPIYNQAFAQISLDEEAQTALQNLLNLDQPDPDSSQIAQILSANETALTLLKEAAARPYLRFDLDFTKGVDLRLPHLRELRHGVRLLAAEAVYVVKSGDREAAGEPLIAALAIAIHFSEEPTLSSFLSVLDFENSIRMSLERVLAETDLSERAIQVIQQNFRQLDSGHSPSSVINNLLVLDLSIYDRIKLESTFIDEVIGSGPSNPARVFAFQLYQLTGLLERDRSRYIDRMANYLRIAELPLSDRVKTPIPAPSFSENPLKADWIHPYILPSMDRTFERDLRTATYRRATLIALAAERHRLATGHFPAQLEDLLPAYLDALPTDPYNPDGTFQWIREETAISIRSQGTTKVPGRPETPIEFRLPVRSKTLP